VKAGLAFQRVAPVLGHAFIRALRATMRIETQGGEAVRSRWAAGQPCLIVFWHGQLLMMPYMYHGPGVRILVSQHRDGELIARIMHRFGFETIRGSTTRGGVMALRRMVRSVREGWDLAVTPDGPRGPRHRVQPGVVEVSRLTGVPIFPVAFGASKKKSFGPGTAFSSRAPSPAGVFCGGTR